MYRQFGVAEICLSGETVQFSVSTQNLVSPSLLFTSTMGLAHGLWDGWITCWLSVSWTRSSARRRRVRFTVYQIGRWSPVSMESVMMLVEPRWLYLKRNTLHFYFSSSDRVSDRVWRPFSSCCDLSTGVGVTRYYSLTRWPPQHFGRLQSYTGPFLYHHWWCNLVAPRPLGLVSTQAPKGWN